MGLGMYGMKHKLPLEQPPVGEAKSGGLPRPLSNRKFDQVMNVLRSK